jgi:putative SOS response-associated peptidase YedK
MCGRFTIAKSPEQIEERFNVTIDRDNYKINFNAGPSQNLPVITNSQPEKVNFYKWGLIPFWTKEIKPYSILINSRSETIKEKQSFRNIFAQRRCLILSDGFYEWKKDGSVKQPYRIILKNNELFAFAGIWDKWINNENTLNTFSIITTEANQLVKQVHDRMPVILQKNDEALWLDNKTGVPELLNLLKPYNPDKMEIFPVSNFVNSVRNNSDELIKHFSGTDNLLLL